MVSGMVENLQTQICSTHLLSTHIPLLHRQGAFCCDDQWNVPNSNMHLCSGSSSSSTSSNLWSKMKSGRFLDGQGFHPAEQKCFEQKWKQCRMNVRNMSRAEQLECLCLSSPELREFTSDTTCCVSVGSICLNWLCQWPPTVVCPIFFWLKWWPASCSWWSHIVHRDITPDWARWKAKHRMRQCDFLRIQWSYCKQNYNSLLEDFILQILLSKDTESSHRRISIVRSRQIYPNVVRLPGFWWMQHECQIFTRFPVHYYDACFPLHSW